MKSDTNNDVVKPVIAQQEEKQPQPAEPRDVVKDLKNYPLADRFAFG